MSTGVKYDQGKPRISLIPAEFIEGVAKAFNHGAVKYGDHNFRNGFAHSRALDAVLRHVLAILRGEETDPESGLPHWCHAGASLGMYAYLVSKLPELNDVHELKKCFTEANVDKFLQDNSDLMDDLAKGNANDCS